MSSEDYINGIHKDAPYECLYWYDGPLLIRTKELENGKYMIATAVTDTDDNGVLFFSARFTPEMWEDYKAEKIDLRDLFVKGTNHATFTLHHEPWVMTPCELKDEYLPTAGLWHYVREQDRP